MLALLRDNYGSQVITLTPDFTRDLRWFHKFLQNFNGTAYFDHKMVDHVRELDAVWGVGVTTLYTTFQ